MKLQSFSNHGMLLTALTLLVYVLASSEQLSVAQSEMASINDNRHDYFADADISKNHVAYTYLPDDHLDINTQRLRNASFPGGNSAYSQYFADNFQYPQEARMNGFEGEIRASFYVNTDGSVSNIRIQKSISPELDAEVVRLINEMPAWNAATLNNEKIRTRVILPMNVRLK